MKNLTVAAVEKLKAGEKRREIPDGLCVGLYLVIQPSGAKGWAARYRWQGKPGKMTLGAFPDVDLAEARKRARAALTALAEGHDPTAAKRAAIPEPDAGRDAFERVGRRFIRQHVKANCKPRYAGEVERLFDKEIFPKWRRRNVKGIERRDVIELTDAIVERGGGMTANRVLSAVSKFFSWCVERDIVEVNPCAGIAKPVKERARDRVLNDDELFALWRAAEKDGAPFGPYMRFMILTGTRRAETAGMLEDELDLERRLWTVPGARTKNGRAHDVYLTDAALAALEAAPRIVPPENGPQYIFSTTGASPVSGYSRAKARLERRMLRTLRALARRRGEDPRKVKIEQWGPHDLRRTIATGMARLGVHLPVIERCLNHVSGSFGGIVSVYQHHSYADQKRAAWEAWALHVEQISTAGPAAEVIPLPRAAARGLAI